MAVKLCYNEITQFSDGNGAPYAGAQLFTYSAGSSTKLGTYKTSAGSTSNTNPIVLDANGRIPFPIWLTAGSSYKFVLAPANDTDPPVSPIWSLDDITGINDSSSALDQWVTGPTPTYVSATQFTLVGDQTTTFHVGRRVKTTNSGGTAYSTISVSAYTALTTITVVNDSTTLDAGLSAVSYSLLSSTNDAIPRAYSPTNSGNWTNTGTWSNSGTWTHSGQLTESGIVSFTGGGLGPTAKQNYSITASVGSNILTCALKGKDGNDPSSTNPVTLSLRSTTLTSGAYNIRQITSATSVAAPQGATLGFANAQSAKVHFYMCDDGSSRALGISGIYQISDDTILVNTTTIGTGSDTAATIYTTTGLTNAAVTYLGYITIATGATAGDWSNAQTVTWSGPPTITGNNVQEFTTTGANTWTKPGGYSSSTDVLVQMWGAGGSGSFRTGTGTCGGGGGGSYREFWLKLDQLSATETATVGAGGVAVSGSNINGNAGASTTFTINGTTITLAGGSAGAQAGASGSPLGGAGANVYSIATSTNIADGGAATAGAGPASIDGGGGGGGCAAGTPGAGGASKRGGGGGGAVGDAGAVASGGDSELAGDGGAGKEGAGAGNPGTSPSGGGGGARNGATSSGAGGNGKVRVTVFI